MKKSSLSVIFLQFLDKFREAAVSVLPVCALVIILILTPFTDVSAAEILPFILSAVCVITGIALFNLGADMAMTPMGKHIGEGLTSSGKAGTLITVCFIMGVLITVAEPDLSVLAGQVSSVVSGNFLIISVGVGVGLFLIVGVLRILKGLELTRLLLFFYMTVFSLAAYLLDLGKGDFLPLSFDSGGVTTGPITVPFIMALCIGIAMTAGGRKSAENSFGMVALCSIGPVIAVLAISSAAKGDLNYSVPDYGTGSPVMSLLAANAKEVGRSLLLMLGFFLVLQIVKLRLPKRKLMQLFIGSAYAFAGLVIFLSAVISGFMPAGYRIGVSLAKAGGQYLIAAFFIIGAVTVIAEPAVHVLKGQVEDVTGGEVTKSAMTIALAIGVGVSVGLSAIRMIYGFSILYYLIPGYLISLGISFFVPGIYTAIAFDSGGVASGPLTSSFVLPMMIGACEILQGEAGVLRFAFGCVSMVAMTPLITIQFLGFKGRISAGKRYRRAMKRIMEADDAQIIYFD